MRSILGCALLLGTDALSPTKVHPADCCSGASCMGGMSLNFPDTVYPVTPRFDFNLTGSLGSSAPLTPMYTAKGSLGLPNHPLGIFGFDVNGTACGEQKLYLESGILAVVTVNFPECPWSGDVLVNGHVDVWTTIPAIPLSAEPVDGISTGFTLEMHVSGVPETPEETPEVFAKDFTNDTETQSVCNQFHDCMSCMQISYCNFCPLDNNCANDNFWVKTKCHTSKNCVGPKCDNKGDCSAHLPDVMCLKMGLSQPSDQGADPTQDVCDLDMDDMPEYPPKSQSAEEDVSIPTEVLDLDMDPLLRWDHIVRPRAKYIEQMVDYFSDKLMTRNNTLLKVILDLGVDKIMQRFPEQQRKEIQGIAKSTGLDVIKIFVYNIMYEVEGLCTSMVSQDAAGNVYHSRNLDFGLFMGDDTDTHNWMLTEMLRPMLTNINVIKDGKSLYNMTQYVGYVGLLTGVKHGGFSISVDTRFDGHLDEYLVLWLLGKYDGNFLSFKTREVMEVESNYTAALQSLSHYRSIGPCYIIVGGAASGEGAVIALSGGQDEAYMVRTLQEEIDTGSFYVLQTNYDWPDAPPAFDDRRYPIMDCMNKLGSGGVSLKSLWGVMSSNPTKNALTTYTTLMSAGSGHFEAYKQYCAPGPHCMPFLNLGAPRMSLRTPFELLV